jgi:guanylate kinase
LDSSDEAIPVNDKLTDAERIIQQVTGQVTRTLFVIAGPSGAGKNTIIKKLMTNNAYLDRVRTYTTRAPREGENTGEQYRFVSRPQFRELAAAGKLMEVDGQDVYGLGDLYSMPADIYDDIDPEKHLVVAEVDIHGTRRLRAAYPGCTTIFVTAPPEMLAQRVQTRADSVMDDQNLTQRMQVAAEQIRAVREFDYVVFNHADIAEAVTNIEAIMWAVRCRVRPELDLEKTLPAHTFAESNS